MLEKISWNMFVQERKGNFTGDQNQNSQDTSSDAIAAEC